MGIKSLTLSFFPQSLPRQLQSSPGPTHAKVKWRWHTKRVVYGQNRDGIGGAALVNPHSRCPVSLACNQERNNSGSRG
ncbi:hypothetical protein Lalb_Chr23g0273651 [Lupinus albus]|uniref:Uncharacterized protein n=1 Tax=Lupinus albus TaxID=3870 RepID=A0A6A4NFA8_LUPAL|nr:hypothetical protein Lalb_Chr23g0273651 [Lupinus albus]